MATLLNKAVSLLGIKDTDEKVQLQKVKGFMWHLGIRQVCTRCGGTGHYSYNQMDGTKCWGCLTYRNGGEVPAKLTRETLRALEAKVAAGELDALRAHWKALREAKAALAPMMRTAQEVYRVVGKAYSDDRVRGEMPVGEFVRSPLFNAQTMANAIFFGPELGRCGTAVMEIIRDVEAGRRVDYLQCQVDMEAAIQALRVLVESWLALEAA